MFEITTDESLFKRIWRSERDDVPRFFSDGSNTKNTSWGDFKGFCANCDRVYALNDSGLLYVERIGYNANIHFSLIRGEKVELNDLISIRDEIFKDFDLIFCYVGVHNRPLKRIVESCGLRYEGFYFLYGWSHNRLLEWRCYSLAKNSIACIGKL